MLRIIGERQGSLEEYLHQDFGQRFIPAHMNEREARIFNYISSSNLTSSADAMVATTLSNLVLGNRGRISVRSARDLHLRDLEEGNYIFVGSPGSNPWVSLFQNMLNFREAEDVVGESMKYFVNKQPTRESRRPTRTLSLPGRPAKITQRSHCFRREMAEVRCSPCKVFSRKERRSLGCFWRMRLLASGKSRH
jgi:hypothetical protein